MGFQNFLTQVGSPSPKQKNLPAFVDVDKPLKFYQLLQASAELLLHPEALVVGDGCGGSEELMHCHPSSSCCFLSIKKVLVTKTDLFWARSLSFGLNQVYTLTRKLICFRNRKSGSVILQGGVSNLIAYFYQSQHKPFASSFFKTCH